MSNLVLRSFLRTQPQYSYSRWVAALPALFKNNFRTFMISSPNYLKEIRERQEGNKIIIEGVYIESDRKESLIPQEVEVLDDGSSHGGECGGSCPICRLKLPMRIRHTDVLILSQFIRSDGCMLPARITGLCRKQQRTVTYLVAMAQKSGLMPNMNPSPSNRDPKKRHGWKKYNKYYDESVIDEFLAGTRKRA